MLRPLLLVAALLAAGCSTVTRTDAARPSPVAPETNGEVRNLLNKLYRSFNYAAGQEPDWVLMRSCFVDGVLFAPEPELGAGIKPRDVDALIAAWQTSMRRRATGNAGYSEWIDDVQMSRVGKLIRVDVAFFGKEPGDRGPRKPGLDSIQLVEVNGQWKVLSFVVQYESKL